MLAESDILFVDNHLLIVNKAAGLLTQPSGTSQDSLELQAKAWIKQAYQKPGNVFLHAVHRLDKPVSGIVVFARTSKALTRLNQDIRDKKTKKIYSALVEGHVSSLEGQLEHYIKHDDFHAEIVPAKHPEAKLARLNYRVIAHQGEHTLLEIELNTGRYHQIRLQLATIGHPILGDRKYGSRMILDDKIALHHTYLTFFHPVTKEALTVHAPLPFYFQ